MGQIIPWEMRSFGSTGGFFWDPFGKKGPYILIIIDCFQAKQDFLFTIDLKESLSTLIGLRTGDLLLLCYVQKIRLQNKICIDRFQVK